MLSASVRLPSNFVATAGRFAYARLDSSHVELGSARPKMLTARFVVAASFAWPKSRSDADDVALIDPRSKFMYASRAKPGVEDPFTTSVDDNPKFVSAKFPSR